MLQIVHDVAPGAPLAFATAEGGETAFAQNIRDLAKPVAQGGAGAKVIVDDVTYFAEPFFQDGVIAQAVDDVVTNSGVTYFSSAGNFQDQAWETTGVNLVSDPIFVSNGTQFVDFDPTAGTSSRQRVTLTNGQSLLMTLQWDNPFFTTSGVTANVGIFVVNPTNNSVVAFSASNTIASQVPTQTVSFRNTTGATKGYDILLLVGGTTSPGRVKWVNYGSNSSGPLTVNTFATNSPTITPHAGSANALAVAAAPYFRQRTPESFTSLGPTTVLFNANGTPKSFAEVRAKPDVTAPDGVDTTFFPPGSGKDAESNGFPNFFGTSAAAPHAAAVAALVQQANPSFTPAQVYARLMATADANIGGAPGNVNLVGAGLVDAYRAVVGNPAPAATSFTDGFEAGVLDQKWEVYNSGSGQTQVATGNGPVNGTHQLTMDTLIAGSFAVTSFSEAILHLNLTGVASAALAFKEKEFNNDADNAMPATFSGHGNYDGVALSVDGTNWVSLLSLTGVNSTAAYQSQSFDLLAAASAAGLTVGADTRVKFQHFSAATSMIPNQGFAFDDVVLTVNHPPTAVDDRASTNDQTPVTVNVLVNDTDLDLPNDTLTVTGVGTPSPNVGGVTFNATSVTYTPAVNFHGQVVFSYTIRDAAGVTSTANVTVTIGDVTRPQVTDLQVHFGNRSASILGLGRTLPWLNVDAFDVFFSEDVSVVQASLAPLGVNVPPYATTGFSYNAGTHVAHWGLSAPLGIDRIQFTLDGHTAAGVKDTSGNLLEGGDFGQTLRVLPGDVNGDGVVSAADMVLARNQSLGSLAATIFADLDGNGFIDLNDVNNVHRRIGTFVP